MIIDNYRAHVLNGLVCIGICFSIHAGTEKAAKLEDAVRLYPIYEKQLLESLPKFGTYSRSIDRSLIKQYITLVRDVLAQKSLSTRERELITQIAFLMIHHEVYRNSSSDSRWKNYAKQEIIKTLSTSKEGTAILQSLAAQNAQLEAEIEAILLDDKLST